MGDKNAFDAEVELTESQRQALRRAAHNGEYQLLLGAGSSLDSVGAGGHSLPGTSKLIEYICSEFGVVAESGDLLWRVYDRAVESVGEERVYTWLRKLFWNVTPPEWMEYFARSPWGTVWTLNVDNTFEVAYSNVKSDSMRPLAVTNWDEEYRQGPQLTVVHLHGVVDREEPRKLVFSLPEYAGSAASDAAWPVNFRDVYGNAPFVILGARVRDEPDIEAVIRRRRPSHEAPSFYVARTITAGLRDDLLRWGLIPVEMTAEEFAYEWAALTELDLEHPLPTAEDLALRVGRQFSELRLSPQPEPVEDHDFIGGEEPEWADIAGNLAAELEWITRAKMDCNQLGKSINQSSVIAYTGRRLTGRSTGLLLLARHLRESSWRTFLFREDGRIDVDAMLGFAKDGKSVALFFDGLADVADDVDRLISRARHDGLTITCVAVDKQGAEARLISRLKATHLAHSRVATMNGRLTGIDASRLVDHLSRIGRLGFLDGKSDTRSRGHFKNRELFDSMADLENAPGFGRRLEGLLTPLSEEVHWKLILLAAYASLVDRKLLVIDAARMVGMDSDALVRLLQGSHPLTQLLSTTGSTVRTRHRFKALSAAVNHFGSNEAALVVRDAISRVSGRLGRESLRARNPSALLVGSFMSYRNLERAFPGADYDNWYASLLSVFGDWSGRFWEQRAILARLAGRDEPSQLAKAESFALRAVSLVPDAYSFTTLGTVLMEKAASGDVDIQAYYLRALEAFEKAASNDRDANAVVSWVAYLRSSLRVLTLLRSEHFALRDESLTQELIEQLEGDWVRIYAQMTVLGSVADHTNREINELRRRYDLIARGEGEAALTVSS
jgi:hypothetical protein